jgi:hypothetical protein
MPKHFATFTVLIAFLTACNSSSDPRAATENFIKLVNKDVDAAYASTSKDFKEATKQEDFKFYVEEVAPELGHVSVINLDLWGVKEGTATVGGNLKYDDGTKSPALFRLKENENEWEILNIDLAPDLEPRNNE